MIQQVTHVVTSRLSFSGEKYFGHEDQMERKNVGERGATL